MFKDAAQQLTGLERDHGRLLPRAVPDETRDAGTEEHLVEVTLFGLLSAFKDVLIQSQEDMTAELIRPEITVTQKINDVMDLLQEKGEALFKSVLLSCRSKLEKIVTFLACLELIRLKLVKAIQRGAFDEIHLVLSVGPEDAAQAKAKPALRRRKK
jgi:segregation and condensation protein A